MGSGLSALVQIIWVNDGNDEYPILVAIGDGYRDKNGGNVTLSGLGGSVTEVHLFRVYAQMTTREKGLNLPRQYDTST